MKGELNKCFFSLKNSYNYFFFCLAFASVSACCCNDLIYVTICHLCIGSNVFLNVGIDLCPFVILQKTEPSVSLSTFFFVRLYGLGSNDAPIGPSPLPLSP